jgi:putative ubiquitin-RnfH superfamily antitoxin RatB of RatAB toxin-antitoxin module
MARESPEPSVEVIYATTQAQVIVKVPFTPGLTAEQAVHLSGLLDSLPEIRKQPLVLGVFGVRVAGEQLLQCGDRVEICRPLMRDPRDRRRELAR